MEFTASQLQAVDLAKIRRDTCIVAGPGSGKTAVLVECYRRLVADAGISPMRLLAITFTERAARSMKQKLAKEFLHSPERRRELEQANVSTVHGFCARLLRENAVVAGIDPQFRILEARQAASLQRRAVTEALDALFEREAAATRELICALASPELAPALAGLYDAVRCAGAPIENLGGSRPGNAVPWSELARAVAELQNARPGPGWTGKQRTEFDSALESSRAILDLPEAPVSIAHFHALDAFRHSGKPRGDSSGNLLQRIKKELIPGVTVTCISEFFAPQREALLRLLADFDRRYAGAKRQAGALDFSDLETLAVRLLDDHPELRRRVQSGFDHILMDEFQDTNGQQARLLDLLRTPDRFYAVGDINQSIYGFRHANPEVFRAYRDGIESAGKHLVELEENWRSRADILRAAQTIIHGAPGIEARELVAKREFAEKVQPSVELIAAIADDVERGLEIEAAWVARRMRELEGTLQLARGPAQFADMALLVRNSEVLAEFTRALDEAGVPYLANLGKGFFETREVLDLIHLLRALDNPRDEISLAAVLRSPFAAASDEALLRLKQDGNLASALRRFNHLDTAAFEAGDRERLERLREQLQRWRTLRDAVGFDRLLIQAMEETGYPWQPGTRAAANIEKFLALARGASSQPLSRFVEELEWFRESDTREPEAPPEDAINAVRIMTVHAAKGLEFPIVFLAALHKGVSDKVEHLAFSRQAGVGVRWTNPATGEHEDDWHLHAIRAEHERHKDDESSRLLYVAMTRAEEHLVFSCSGKKAWADTVLGGLAVDVRAPREAVEPVAAPDSETFAVRVLAADQKPQPLGRLAANGAGASVQLVKRPEVTGQHDSTANVTDISGFADCPRRYYLERYLGWEPSRRARWKPSFEDDEAGKAPEATELGIEVHQLLAGAADDAASAEARKLAGAFRSSTLGRRAARADRIEREWDFVMAVDDIVLRGQIDLWFEESGELVVVDYKTDQVKADDAPAQAARYATQLRLYALALERATGRRPDRGFIYLLRPNAAVSVDVRENLFDDPPEALVARFREAQSRLDFPLREGEHCGRCPFYHGLCPAGTDASRVGDIVHAAAVDGEDLGGDEPGLG